MSKLGWRTQAYCDRALAFGWKAIEIDGHNLEEIDEAYIYTNLPEQFDAVIHIDDTRGVEPLDRNPYWQMEEEPETIPTGISTVLMALVKLI